MLRDTGDGCQVDGAYCLVFKPDVEEEGKRWVRNKQSEHSGIDLWVAFAPDSFCNFINYFTVDPFEPSDATKKILLRFQKAIESNEIDKIDSELKVVRTYLDTCSLRYLLGECEYLAEEIKKAIEPLNRISVEDEMEALELEMLLEDIDTTIKRYLKL